MEFDDNLRMAKAIVLLAILMATQPCRFFRSYAQEAGRLHTADKIAEERASRLYFQMMDIEADSSAQKAVRMNCGEDGLEKNCRQARARLQSRQNRIEAVRIAELRFANGGTDLSFDRPILFSSEEDLLAKLGRKNGTDPVRIFKHEGSPIYLIKFGSGALQDAAFSRVGKYIEEAGKVERGTYPEGRSDGYDVRVSDLAQFYNLAEQERLPLNPIEERIKGALLQSGLMEKYRDEGSKKYKFMASKTAAILSVGGERVGKGISHELNHAVFFTDRKYRDRIEALYNKGLSTSEKVLVDKVMKDIARVGPYDFKNDHELFLTELAAFFRDPNELWNSYLKGLKYAESVQLDIRSIAVKVRAQEMNSSFYKPYLPARISIPGSAAK